MASIEKRIVDGNTRWLARIRKKGISRTKTFSTKQASRQWAERIEREIEEASIHGYSALTARGKTVADMFERYAHDVSPQKRGGRWEGIRLNKLAQTNLGAIALEDFSASDIVEWRDLASRRLEPASVNRELTIIKTVCRIAHEEWNWLAANPAARVRKLKPPKARERRIDPVEEQAIMEAGGYVMGQPPYRSKQRVAAAAVLAIETAMRQGEVMQLTPEHLDFDGLVIRLHDHMTKGGEKRSIPISERAYSVLCDVLTVYYEKGFKTLFGIKAENCSQVFRRIRDKAELGDLTFHDTRREALSRMAKLFPVLELAKISGHKDVNLLLRVYYQTDEQDLVRRMHGASPGWDAFRERP